MGREIRRVPPNWQHPKREHLRLVQGRYQYVEEYQPMYERDFGEVMEEWYAGWKKWQIEPDPAGEGCTYWEWAGSPPDPQYYQSGIKTEDRTWYQAYETVSEGTPVSPAFATKEELARYLADYGDFWDQKRIAEGRQSGEAGWGIEAARKFVGCGWAPTGVVVGNQIMTARDGI